MCIAGRVTQDVIKSAYDLNNLIFLGARVPQIYQNFMVTFLIILRSLMHFRTTCQLK